MKLNMKKKNTEPNADNYKLTEKKMHLRHVANTCAHVLGLQEHSIFLSQFHGRQYNTFNIIIITYNGS